jgi:hypothetical protein
VGGTIAAHVELAVADSDNLASACMFMRDLVSCGRTVMPLVGRVPAVLGRGFQKAIDAFTKAGWFLFAEGTRRLSRNRRKITPLNRPRPVMVQGETLSPLYY